MYTIVALVHCQVLYVVAESDYMARVKHCGCSLKRSILKY